MSPLTKHRSASFALLTVGLVSCGTKQTCFLPVLRTNETVKVLSVVGQPGSRGDSCPAPVPTKLAIGREYGALYLEWGVSTHFLVMRASSYDDQVNFDISGSGVKPYRSPAPSTAYQGYTHIKMFPGSDFNPTPPITEGFSVIVKHPNRVGEQLEDEIQFQYDTVQCTCTLHDG